MTRDPQSRIIVGIMTGTSLDGIDACAMRVHGHAMAMRTEYLGAASIPLLELTGPLRALADDEPVPASTVATLRRRLGERCGDAVAAIGLRAPIDLIAVHGQTVHHAPPESWQLIDPFPIAHRFSCRVACDLRGLDRTAGGCGAPITPVADWILHRGKESRVIVNLGGFINCTVLPDDQHDAPRGSIRGFDVCPCNHLLDAVARIALDAPYDDGGTLGLSGTVCLPKLELIVRHLDGMDGGSRSLGTGDECVEFVPDVLHAIGPADTAATFCAAIASCLQSALRECPAENVLLAGGGTRNAALVRAIEERMGQTMNVGRLPHGDEREAASMAVLAALAEDGEPVTLPGVTGRGETSVRDGLWCGPRTDQTP
ncbi:MAG: hypothetical protein CMJ41_06105 [Phycisphaerae bacterium]|nr:hypothetical protein [Phycisphaerae bacterium]